MNADRQQRRGRRAAPVAAWMLAGVCLLTAGDVDGGVADDAIDCSRADTLCVDDDSGPQREFNNIQRAVNRARAGDTVVVFEGEYKGFRVKRSGTEDDPIVIQGRPGARVVTPERRSDDGIYVRRASHVVIAGFEVDGADMRFGIATHDARSRRPMRGLQIRDNVVVGAESTNIYLSQVADSVIEGNVAAYSRDSHGIYLANAGSDDTVLRGNTCYGNGSNGIHFNGDASVGGDGVHTGVVVDGNVLYDNEANGIDADGLRASQVVNNLIFANGRHGLRAFAIDAAAGPADLVIANNTFYDNGAWAVKLTEDDGGHVVFNNILLSDAGSLVVDADVTADYNVGDRYSLDGESTVIGLGAWQAAGQGAHSFSAGPGQLFARVNQGDFTLRASSKARDAGVDMLAGVSAPGLDLERVQRPQGGAFDLGAYERPSGGGRR